LDYFEPLALPHPANASTKEKKKVEEEVKEEVKEPLKKKEPVATPKEEKPKEKEIEPNADMLIQLTSMGFPLELSKKGLIKFKNQSAEAAIDIIMVL
jgi:uncharacterized UBP type Zn finger protein